METTRRHWIPRSLTAIVLIVASLTAVLPITRTPAASLQGTGQPYGRYTIGAFHWNPVGVRLSSDRRSPVRSFSRAAAATTGSITDRAQLELPDAAFPADLSLVESDAMDAAALDNTVFAALHTQTYTALGAMGGWYQYYSKGLSDGLFDDVYLSSYYPSPDAAATAFTDVRSNLDAFGSGGPCSSGEQCYQIMTTITFPDGPYRGLLRVVRSSNALAEMIVDGPAADFSSLQPAETADLNLLTAGFLTVTLVTAPTPTNTAKPSPTPTSVPVSTPTPLPSPTVTPSPTSTPVPLAVTIKIARSSSKAGQRQTITVDTSPGASVTIQVTFPSGRTLHHLATAGSTGTVTWHFKEPAKADKGSNHTVKVAVTAQDAGGRTAQATAHYSG